MNSYNIESVLCQLDIPQNISKCNVIDRSREDEDRFICIVKTDNNQSYVVKFYKNNYDTIEKVNGWAKLAIIYKQQQINVPEFKKFSDGNYAILKEFEGKEYLIWVEDYLSGKTLDDLNLGEHISEKLFEQLGKCLGRMHTAAKDKNLKFDWNSAWVLFDKFCEEDEFDENYLNAYTLYTELKKMSVNHDILEKIWENYNEIRERIKIGYDILPNGAIQGDLSTNNILVDTNHSLCGIIDFNIGGNDVFVNHMLQEGIFLAYWSDDFWNTKEELLEMEGKLSKFLEGYCENYKLSPEEKEKMNDLYQIIRPFRMEKVYPTIRIAGEGSIQEVNKRLDWIYLEMQKPFTIKSSSALL
ncbi:phosphotransferase enzyme family protein [Clostridium tagluense]|uniref:phosphotransferase enzyme family protein n=1 Tax=Clostridium tagluense TaxID=360422 RepID=UPI001CF461A8|nr:aminoglycoside phosphotransferase family protein [Clostridium tagluense]MCB2301028.1 phosphotransferase [Clostridium tagluense]